MDKKAIAFCLCAVNISYPESKCGLHFGNIWGKRKGWHLNVVNVTPLNLDTMSILKSTTKVIGTQIFKICIHCITLKRNVVESLFLLSIAIKPETEKNQTEASQLCPAEKFLVHITKK